MDNKKIDIIITTYNSSQYIAKLLLSIKQQDYSQYNCFIIDDASLDDTVKIVKEGFPWVKLIVQRKNHGPSKNRNIAISMGSAPYIVVLDSDVFLSDTSWLSKALKIMENKQNIGQVASMIVSGYDEDILLDCGIKGEHPFFGGIYHKKNKNDVLGKHQISRRVLGACTAGTILRRDVFEKIGGFDSKYYYLAEDLDLSLRIHLLGYDVIYDPCLVCPHFESQAMGKRARLKNYLYYRNSLLSLAGNYPFKYAFEEIFVFSTQAILFPLYYFITQMGFKRKRLSFETTKIYFKVLVFIALNIPYILIKRWKVDRYRQRPRQYLIDIDHKLNQETALTLSVKSLIHEITNRCNAKCRMCFLYQELNKETELLTLDEIRKMFQSFKELNNIVLGGGEPFLRNDVDQICDILIKNNNNIAITIPTNGSLPDVVYDKTKIILGHGCNNLKISLSLDGLAEYHDRNRGIPDLFSKIQECYIRLTNLKKIYGGRLQIQVNTCLSRDNFSQIDDLFNYLVANMSEASWVFEPIRGSFNQETASPLLKSDWISLFEKIDKFNSTSKLSNYDFLKKMYEYSILTLDKKAQAIPCHGGEGFIAIDFAGNIRPCETLPSVTNIRDIDYDINNLLADQKWMNIRDSIKQKKCYCTHFCWLGYSLERGV